MRALLLMLGLLAVSLTGLTACGGGGGGGSADKDAVREAAYKALTARNIATLLMYADTAEWLQVNEDPAASSYRDASTEEKRVFDDRLYEAMGVVEEMSELKDNPAVRAAIDAGTVEILGQVNAAYVRFEGPDAEREGTIKFIAKMQKGLDGNWRLVNIQPDF